MEPVTRIDGLVVPLDRANVDTDAIIPKQFLKAIGRTGFGPNLFDAWRYADGAGQPGQDCSQRPLNMDFALNQPRYQGAAILLARENFGCGSSREHAVWALQEFGIRCVIAPSFADIFHANCGKNGLLAVALPEADVDRLFRETAARSGYRLVVDLASQQVIPPDGRPLHFDIDGALKDRLLHGLDDIALTLAHADEIRAYERRRAHEAPWLFPDLR